MLSDDDGGDAQHMDVDHDEDTQDNDDDDDRPAKRAKNGKSEVDDTPHCDINFVRNTQYSLLAGDSNNMWGSAKAEDPSPKVPAARKKDYKLGDYLLIKGINILPKHTGTNYTKVTFDPEEELILTNEWTQFEESMSEQDLVDLDDTTFLLWWQNVKPPAVPKPKAPTVAKKAAKKKKK